MKILKLCIALAFTVGLYSCQQENAENQEKQNILDLVKIVDINARMDNLVKNDQNNGVQSRGPCSYVILSWDGEWGRASKNCDGWGLCNSGWFYWDCNRGMNGNTAAPLELDIANNRHYIDILFDAPVPSNIPVEDLALVIDEQFQVWVEDLQLNLTFQDASYPYNPNLGQYGGIRIYLD